MKKLLIFSFVCCISFVTINADYLKVSRDASVKTQPLSGSPVVTKIIADTYLVLLDDGNQENGYYHVQLLNTNQTGWIYRTYVRRYTGDIPTENLDIDDDNPLSDKTFYLTDQQKIYANRHLELGKPQAVYERVYEGYVVGMDARLKIPVWVQYELTRQEVEGIVERTDDFRPDYSIPYGSRSELSDYSGSGYDRGHMAPAADMKRNEKVMSESFFLSNMSPQVGINFNRGIWAQLEEAVRGWVKQKGTLTIITGPVFMPEDSIVTYKVIGENNVAVPTYFFKIVINTSDPENIESLAFLLPNKAITDGDIKDFLTSIDYIEKLTGLDFLSALPGIIQDNIEQKTAQNIW
ncbi:MAG: DNA/RNA non-specific endonuclease [Bacteroidales bacterium]|nr:DNA/RNA non-specific endonuclease [Bacteroidales bacterium]